MWWWFASVCVCVCVCGYVCVWCPVVGIAEILLVYGVSLSLSPTLLWIPSLLYQSPHQRYEYSYSITGDLTASYYSVLSFIMCIEGCEVIEWSGKLLSMKAKYLFLMIWERERERERGRGREGERESPYIQMRYWTLCLYIPYQLPYHNLCLIRVLKALSIPLLTAHYKPMQPH